MKGPPRQHHSLRFNAMRFDAYALKRNGHTNPPAADIGPNAYGGGRGSKSTRAHSPDSLGLPESPPEETYTENSG